MHSIVIHRDQLVLKALKRWVAAAEGSVTFLTDSTAALAEMRTQAHKPFLLFTGSKFERSASGVVLARAAKAMNPDALAVLYSGDEISIRRSGHEFDGILLQPNDSDGPSLGSFFLTVSQTDDVKIVRALIEKTCRPPPAPKGANIH